jgi:hypothetical protein
LESDTYFKEFSAVIITIIDADLSAVDSNVAANAEVLGKVGLAICLDDHVALQERTLRDSTVLLLRLCDHDRPIFKVVKDRHLANSKVFKTALDNALFTIAVKSEDL